MLLLIFVLQISAHKTSDMSYMQYMFPMAKFQNVASLAYVQNIRPRPAAHTINYQRIVHSKNFVQLQTQISGVRFACRI